VPQVRDDKGLPPQARARHAHARVAPRAGPGRAGTSARTL
jgi:hypothetical protein